MFEDLERKNNCYAANRNLNRKWRMVSNYKNVSNFKEIYELLNNLGISKKVSSVKTLTTSVNKLIKYKPNSNLLTKKIEQIGSKILNATLAEIKIIFKKNGIQ